MCDCSFPPTLYLVLLLVIPIEYVTAQNLQGVVCNDNSDICLSGTRITILTDRDVIIPGNTQIKFTPTGAGPAQGRGGLPTCIVHEAVTFQQRIQCGLTVPFGTRGMWELKVPGVDGTSVIEVNSDYQPRPKLSAIRGCAVEGRLATCADSTIITITGANFDTVTTVNNQVVVSPQQEASGGPIVCRRVEVISDAELRCGLSVPTGTEGHWGIEIRVAGYSCCEAAQVTPKEREEACSCATIVPGPRIVKVSGCEDSGCYSGATLVIVGDGFDTKVPTNNQVFFSCHTGQCTAMPTCGSSFGANHLLHVTSSTILCPLTIPTNGNREVRADDILGTYSVTVQVRSVTASTPFGPVLFSAVPPLPPMVQYIKGCSFDGQQAKGCPVNGVIILEGSNFDGNVGANNMVIWMCKKANQCTGTPPTSNVISSSFNHLICLTSWRGSIGGSPLSGHWKPVVSVVGSSVTATPGIVSAEFGICGDGYRITTEECDDGNELWGDGCNGLCEIEDGWTCTTSLTTICNSNCGDGFRVGKEQCDDGNDKDHDGCNNDCTVSSGWTCYTIVEPSITECRVAHCGNGMVERDMKEACDDGNSFGNDGCDVSCAVEKGWECTDEYLYSDDGNLDEIVSQCSTVCGDGIRTVDEVCDDGNKHDNDGCNSNCSIVPAWNCFSPVGQTTVCEKALCGNGRLDKGEEITGSRSPNLPAPDEECDDGNARSGDGCNPSCKIEKGWNCNTPTPLNSGDASIVFSAAAVSMCAEICGDAIRTNSEACDDGNQIAGDGCHFCRIEQGWLCDGLPEHPSRCHKSICGNGMLEYSEDCDDGNTMNGDGCDTLCETELGWDCTKHVVGHTTIDEDNLNINTENTASTSNKDTKQSLQGFDDDTVQWSIETKTTTTMGAADEPPRSITVGIYISHCVPRCGDGKRLAVEPCDDGDKISGNGCSTECEIEADFVCKGEVGTLSVCDYSNACGNGLRNSQELCDDGNLSSGDGCDSSCKIEEFWECIGPVGSKSLCSAICGDGVRMVTEACDDNNKLLDDGCDHHCRVELGWSCTGAMAQLSDCVFLAACGDGAIQPGEECDDGNVGSGDGCSASCVKELGWNCQSKPLLGHAEKMYSFCNPVCGDGLRLPRESCDDANTNNGDGCTDGCTVEPGYTCLPDMGSDMSMCVLTPQCGDGVVMAPDRPTPDIIIEQCDDGNRNSGDGCSSLCQLEAGWTCDSRGVCKTQCGDGYRTLVEQCDDGNNIDRDGCDSYCNFELGYYCRAQLREKSVCFPQCGDGLMYADEECDDGNLQGGDGCTAHCTVEPGYKCDTAITNFQTTGTDAAKKLHTQGNDSQSWSTHISNAYSPSVCHIICGDSTRLSVEECDDGNTETGDGCSEKCTIEAGFICAGQFASTCYKVQGHCGDGVIHNSFEQCDDGNFESGDGCSPICKIEPNWTCRIVEISTRVDDRQSVGTTESPKKSVCRPECGDGSRNVYGNEECDDGNNDNGDGCNHDCKIESRFICKGGPGERSTCKHSCGNGIRNIGEECDDGNLISRDGCSPSCVAEPGWYCLDVYGIKSSCVPNTCGDGNRTSIEPCDDANLLPFDGCDSLCNIEPGYLCDGQLLGTSKCVIPDMCGDGFQVEGEECDDGNTKNRDGCSTTCRVEEGWYCQQETNIIEGQPKANTCVTICGDGLWVSHVEQCDDANTRSGDGCDATCHTENGWLCNGIPGDITLCEALNGNPQQGEGRGDNSDGSAPSPTSTDDNLPNGTLNDQTKSPPSDGGTSDDSLATFGSQFDLLGGVYRSQNRTGDNTLNDTNTDTDNESATPEQSPEQSREIDENPGQEKNVGGVVLIIIVVVMVVVVVMVLLVLYFKLYLPRKRGFGSSFPYSVNQRNNSNQQMIVPPTPVDGAGGYPQDMSDNAEYNHYGIPQPMADNPLYNYPPIGNGGGGGYSGGGLPPPLPITNHVSTTYYPPGGHNGIPLV